MNERGCGEGGLSNIRPTGERLEDDKGYLYGQSKVAHCDRTNTGAARIKSLLVYRPRLIYVRRPYLTNRGLPPQTCLTVLSLSYPKPQVEVEVKDRLPLDSNHLTSAVEMRVPTTLLSTSSTHSFTKRPTFHDPCTQ